VPLLDVTAPRRMVLSMESINRGTRISAVRHVAIGRFCCRSPLKLAATRDSPALGESRVEADDDGAA
jgi:hypothetical protein